MNTARHFTFPYRDLPLSVGAPDTIEATARSSRIARMTVFMMTVLFSWPDGMLWQVTATEFIPISVRVRTHQQSRVESNPVQSDSRRRSRASVAYIQWPPRQCVHTSRVKSSHTSLAESRVVMPHASFSSVRLWWSGGTEEMDVEKFLLLMKNQEAIYNASRCENRNRFLLWWWCS